MLLFFFFFVRFFIKKVTNLQKCVSPSTSFTVDTAIDRDSLNSFEIDSSKLSFFDPKHNITTK